MPSHLPASRTWGAARRWGRRARWLAACLSAGALAAQAGVVEARFDIGAEGWAAAGNGGEGLQWRADGGHPAGHLALADGSEGWAYFAAPAAFRAPIEVGARLSFDLRSTTDARHPVASAVRVALVGAGLALVAESVQPDDTWSGYDFLLGTSGGFRVLPSAADEFKVSARLPTAEEWVAVLGALNSLYISADYSAANPVTGGFELAELDNVRLEATLLAAVPEPATAGLLLLALGALACARRR